MLGLLCGEEALGHQVLALRLHELKQVHGEPLGVLQYEGGVVVVDPQVHISHWRESAGHQTRAGSKRYYIID